MKNMEEEERKINKKVGGRLKGRRGREKRQIVSFGSRSGRKENLKSIKKSTNIKH